MTSKATMSLCNVEIIVFSSFAKDQKKRYQMLKSAQSIARKYGYVSILCYSSSSSSSSSRKSYLQHNVIISGGGVHPLSMLIKLNSFRFLSSNQMGEGTGAVLNDNMAKVKRVIDLRSDTVTKPTEAMRMAMANAEVDDDVLGNDPTALLLETEIARIMNKEAGLFVPSGTMGNLISVLVHCNARGSEVILGDMSHIHISENGGISTIGGVHPRTVKNNKDGTMDVDLIEAAIRDPKDELHYPTTRLICIENSHANSGGRCLTVEYTDKVGELAKKHGLKLHIDGARIFNAATALGVPVDRLVQAADSVSVCLSKGVGAPVGTVIVGSTNFITKARTLRKTLGGGMRQVGVLCAAALVAVRDNVKKLEDDHRNAKLLADGLNQIMGLKVDMSSVETNIIYVHVCETSSTTAPRIGKYLEDHGILVVTRTTHRMRIVLHHQVTTSDVQHALTCIREALSGASSELINKRKAENST